MKITAPKGSYAIGVSVVWKAYSPQASFVSGDRYKATQSHLAHSLDC